MAYFSGMLLLTTQETENIASRLNKDMVVMDFLHEYDSPLGMFSAAARPSNSIGSY